VPRRAASHANSKSLKNSGLADGSSEYLKKRYQKRELEKPYLNDDHGQRGAGSGKENFIIREIIAGGQQLGRRRQS